MRQTVSACWITFDSKLITLGRSKENTYIFHFFILIFLSLFLSFFPPRFLLLFFYIYLGVEMLRLYYFPTVHCHCFFCLIIFSTPWSNFFFYLGPVHNNQSSINSDHHVSINKSLSKFHCFVCCGFFPFIIYL